MGVSQISSTSWGISLRGPPDPEGHKEHPQRPSSNLELRKDTQNESKSIGPSCWLPVLLMLIPVPTPHVPFCQQKLPSNWKEKTLKLQSC